jgi:DNA topoisomerase IA
MVRYVCIGIGLMALVFTSCIEDKMDRIENGELVQAIVHAEEVREAEEQLKEAIAEREEKEKEEQDQ